MRRPAEERSEVVVGSRRVGSLAVLVGEAAAVVLVPGESQQVVAVELGHVSIIGAVSYDQVAYQELPGSRRCPVAPWRRGAR